MTVADERTLRDALLDAFASFPDTAWAAAYADLHRTLLATGRIPRREAPVADERTAARVDTYRDTLEAWAAWWNNVGRQHYRHYIVPPITMLSEALACSACAGVGPYEAEGGPDRCQVCARRLP